MISGEITADQVKVLQVMDRLAASIVAMRLERIGARALNHAMRAAA